MSDETVVPEDASALIFLADGSLQLCLPKTAFEDGSIAAAPHSLLAAALAKAVTEAEAGGHIEAILAEFTALIKEQREES